MIQSVARLKVNHPEEHSSHFLSLSEYFPDAVTLDKLSVLELCSPTSISTECVDLSSASPCITSTPRTVSSTLNTVSTIGINTHLMSPAEVSMESNTTFTSFPSSSTQSTPLVGTAAVHTQYSLKYPKLTCSTQWKYWVDIPCSTQMQIQVSLLHQHPEQVLSQCPLLRSPSQALPQVLLLHQFRHSIQALSVSMLSQSTLFSMYL